MRVASCRSAVFGNLTDELTTLRMLDLSSAYRVEAERYEPLLQLTCSLQGVSAQARNTSWPAAMTKEFFMNIRIYVYVLCIMLLF